MSASASYCATLTPNPGESVQAWGQRIAACYQVPWPIFEAMIQYESGWSTSRSEVSSAGAQGIAQIMPDTAAGWNVDPWDPYAALKAAAQHLSEYYTQFGNSWSNALAAYNGGGTSGGMAAAYRGGYPQHVLSVAKMGGSSSPTASSVASASRSSSSGGSGVTPATGGPAWLTQPLSNLWWGMGPGAVTAASNIIVLPLAVALFAIGGIWLIMGNTASRTVVANTTKTAAKAATLAA